MIDSFRRTLGALTVVSLAGTAMAQFDPLIPFARTLDVLIVDSSADGVWRVMDRNQDGDFNDAGEVIDFYSDTVGSIALGNPTCVCFGPDGTAYVADSTQDVVVALRDGNADGDATDPGAEGIFYVGSSTAAVVMTSAQGIASDDAGVLFVASSNTSSSGTDAILRLEDLNGDGDADDPGEATEFATFLGYMAGDSIPADVRVGADRAVYYVENGATGYFSKGIYRLFDINGDGDANDPGENTAFYIPAPQTSTAQHWGLAAGSDGYLYLTDSTNEIIWRVKDLDSSGSIGVGTTEEEMFYSNPSSSLIWDVMIRDDGLLLAGEDQTPDRLVLFESGQAPVEVYSELVSPHDITKPRAGAFFRGPYLTTPASVQIGTTANFTVSGAEGHFAVLWTSNATSGFSFAPFGTFELNPAVILQIAGGTVGEQGTAPMALRIPALPGLVGTLPVQAFAGDFFRPYLSNLGQLVITP